MSIYFSVTHSDGTEEDLLLASLDEATRGWEPYAQAHNFRLMTGVTPTAVNKTHIEEWLKETEELLAGTCDLDYQRRYPGSNQRLQRFLEMLRDLRDKTGWRAYIG